MFILLVHLYFRGHFNKSVKHKDILQQSGFKGAYKGKTFKLWHHTDSEPGFYLQEKKGEVRG